MSLSKKISTSLGLSTLIFVMVASSASAEPVTRDYLVRNGVSAGAATEALNSYDHFSKDIKNKTFLAIVDFNKSALDERMYIVNMLNGVIEKFRVAHGVNSGDNWVTQLSNELAKSGKDVGSLRSTSGNFMTLTTKHSDRAGFSLTVNGLDQDNKSAFDRFIYVHGATGVNPDWAKAHDGIVRRSEGCFMVDKPYTEHVIEELKSGSLLYAYWNHDEMLANYLASADAVHATGLQTSSIGVWKDGEQL